MKTATVVGWTETRNGSKAAVIEHDGKMAFVKLNGNVNLTTVKQVSYDEESAYVGKSGTWFNGFYQVFTTVEVARAKVLANVEE